MTTAYLDLPVTTIRVLDAYKSLAKKKNESPSYSEVAEECSMTSAAVAKHVAILLKKKYVQKREGTWRNIVLTDKAL